MEFCCNSECDVRSNYFDIQVSQREKKKKKYVSDCLFRPKLLSPFNFSSRLSSSEEIELSADKLEKGNKKEEVCTSGYKSFKETMSKQTLKNKRTFTIWF